jgi:excisionase family DNA binding protein
MTGIHPNSERNIVASGLMSVPEAAAFLGLSRTSVYRLMAQGDLPYVSIRRTRRIPRQGVLHLAAANLHGGQGIQ